MCINKKCKDEADLKGNAPQAIDKWDNGELFFQYLTEVKESFESNFRFKIT